MALADRVKEQDVAALPDWQVAEVLNTPDVANGLKRVPIPRKEAQTLMFGRGAWARLRLIADGRYALTGALPDAQTLLEAVLGAVDQLRREDTEVIDATSDLDWAQLQQVLGLFVLNTALTKVDANHMAAILALGQRPMSWAEANDVKVDARAVGLARGGV